MQDGKYVILCIDDDEDILECLRMILDENGFSPSLADSAEKGLQLFEESKPDFIFVDLMMESADSGIGFVRKVRELDKDIPIYMLSSVGEGLDSNIDHNSIGLNGVLQKPIDNDFLLSLLKTKLG